MLNVVIIFEDYNKGVLHSKNIELLIQKCISKGIPTIVDPKKSNFLAYKNVTLFKPNLKEIKEGLKLESDLSDPSNLNDAISELMTSLNNEFTLVTLSERGVVITGKNETHHIASSVRTSLTLRC